MVVERFVLRFALQSKTYGYTAAFGWIAHHPQLRCDPRYNYKYRN